MELTAHPDPGLDELGWTASFNAQWSPDERSHTRPVRVMAVHRGFIAIAGAGPERLIPSFLPDAHGADARPTVGDWLLIDTTTHDPLRILARANLFKRPAPGNSHRQQQLAANVDTLFIVASCNQDFNVARLERYLVLAREVAVTPVIVLTKADLTDTPDMFVAAARAMQPGLVVEIVNARDPHSVAQLAAWCGVGKTVALLGSSGVGKSTLVNSLRGTDALATQAVRAEDGKGRHTTTARAMYRLDHGGWLLDTPGMRELQLADADAGIADVFDDVVTLALQCRFSNCTHRAEPGCAVRAAIDAGAITVARLDRWRKLTAEDAHNTAVPKLSDSGKRKRR